MSSRKVFISYILILSLLSVGIGGLLSYRSGRLVQESWEVWRLQHCHVPDAARSAKAGRWASRTDLLHPVQKSVCNDGYVYMARPGAVPKAYRTNYPRVEHKARFEQLWVPTEADQPGRRRSTRPDLDRSEVRGRL